jgi:plasmid stabilization system protein ParE
MNLAWSRKAAGDVSAIFDYIARDSRLYATRIVARIETAALSAANLPEAGSLVEEYNQSDLRQVLAGPYRIIYRLEPDQIVVLTVIHGARQLPEFE